MAGFPKACTDALEAHLDADMFKALCDPSRLVLVARLATSADAMNVSDASACCGVHISGTSRHLSLLKAAGIVAAEKRGREVFYRLRTKHLVSMLRGLADCLETCGSTLEEDDD